MSDIQFGDKGPPKKYDRETIERNIHKWQRRISEQKSLLENPPPDRSRAEIRRRIANYETELQRWKNGGHYASH